MNIVVLSTTALATPPVGGRYGGMERVAWLIAHGLEELGHTICLIAKNDSQSPVNGMTVYWDDERTASKMADYALRRFGTIDCWIDITHDKWLSVLRPELPQINNHQVMSLMGSGINPVLISDGQHLGKFPGVDAKIIHQPIDLDELKFNPAPREDYLLYMGQLIPEKRIEWAINTALGSGRRLYIFGPGWGPAEYHAMLRAYEHDNPGQIFIQSDIGGKDKLMAIQNAAALIHPVGGLNWCEAGAIIALEALATGTPVIGSDNGCLPEYIQPGVNGLIGRNVREMIAAVDRLSEIKPEDCRRSVESFDYRVIAKQYEDLCSRVASGERWNVR